LFLARIHGASVGQRTASRKRRVNGLKARDAAAAISRPNFTCGFWTVKLLRCRS
jgi:hypothetical protein